MFFISFIVFLFIILPPALIAQQLPAPMNRQHNLNLEKQLNIIDVAFHTSFKPYLQSWVDSCLKLTALASGETNDRQRNLIYRKLRKEHLFIVDTVGFYLSIDPVFNFEAGVDTKDTGAKANTALLYRNTRGFIVQGNIGKKMSFFSSFYESQAFFPSYLDDFVKEYSVVPGQGRVKSFKTTGYDYGIASGVVSITPVKQFNIQLGHGKNFIGDGYRSLALSDNAFNYPFVKFTTKFWKIQFTNLYADFRNLNVELPTSAVTERRFQRKPGSIHHLDFTVNKRISIGVFEETIWKTSARDENNALIGANFKLKATDHLSLYGQAALDDLKNNKYAYQLGFKSYDLFGIKNLHLQSEFNRVQPYMYTQADSTKNFAHYNQSLAHPTGAAFAESFSVLDYSYKGFFAEISINYTVYKEDSLRNYNYGKDIFKPYNNMGSLYLPAGEKNTTVLYQSMKIGFLVNPVTNMQILAGVINRNEHNAYWNKNTLYYYISFKTSLENYYYDF